MRVHICISYSHCIYFYLKYNTVIILSMVSFSSVVLENLFAELLFVSFFIYYAKIPFSITSSLTNIIVITITLYCCFSIESYNSIAIFIGLLIATVIGSVLYYVINNLFNTKYWFVSFVFPVIFLAFFNSFKLLHYIADSL